MRRYYDNDDCCIRDLHANIISINERDEWIRCGFCPF
jgi:hypothetical protein